MPGLLDKGTLAQEVDPSYEAIKAQVVGAIRSFAAERSEEPLRYGTVVDALSLFLDKEKDMENSDIYFLPEYLKQGTTGDDKRPLEDVVMRNKALETLARELSMRLLNILVDNVSRFHLTNEQMQAIRVNLVRDFEIEGRVQIQEDVAEEYRTLINPYLRFWGER